MKSGVDGNKARIVAKYADIVFAYDVLYTSRFYFFSNSCLGRCHALIKDLEVQSLAPRKA